MSRGPRVPRAVGWREVLHTGSGHSVTGKEPLLNLAVQRRKHLAEARRFEGFSDGIGIYAIDHRGESLH